MKAIRKFVLVVVSIVICTGLTAAADKDNDNRNPIGCRDVGY